VCFEIIDDSSLFPIIIIIPSGVAVFSLAMKTPKEETETAFVGLVYLLIYIAFDSFTSQWQDKVYTKYGRTNVDPYQMMLGVNTSAIIFTTAGLLFTGDFPVVWEFLSVNPKAFQYNIITAITSASGQLTIFYTIREFGPIVFTVMMIIRQMISICISAVVFDHVITGMAFFGMLIVFGVLFYQTRRKYYAKLNSMTNNSAGK
jgi:adenosine 3'-phospho 5'-phosphosulfate transporter B2